MAALKTNKKVPHFHGIVKQFSHLLSIRIEFEVLKVFIIIQILVPFYHLVKENVKITLNQIIHGE